MNLTDIVNTRLVNQQIAGTKLKTTKEIISCLGAMQAQNYSMAKWGVGLRMPGSTEQSIESAIDNGEIIRTHLLRPTWHFVSANDIYWMLELSAPQIKASFKSRHRQLEITEDVINKSNHVMINALSKGNHLTRDELVTELEKSGIVSGDNRAAHLLMLAELDRLICSGKNRDKKQTYALLKERVPDKKILSKNEALYELAKKYFSGHCPATLQDFAWWSGLHAKDTRQALEMIKPEFISEVINSQIYWLTPSCSVPENDKESVYLLPAYDEYIISYKDRSAFLRTENLKKVISSYGMFWPVIVINGQVTGLWKRTIKGDTLIIETNLFKPLKTKMKNVIEEKAVSYGNFLGRKVKISHKSG